MSQLFTIKPTAWELDHAHALKAGEEFAKAHDGELPHNAFWRDIEFRYDRNAEAFSINHPNWKRFLDMLILERAEQHRIDAPHLPLAPCDAPCIPVLACDPPTPRTATLSTPEPSALEMLGLAMGVMALILRFTRKRRTR